jgi:hypothetical protein
MMEAVHSSEISVNYLTTRRHILEDSTLQGHWSKNFKSWRIIHMQITAFWILTSCSLEKVRCFGGTYHFRLQGRKVNQARNQHKQAASWVNRAWNHRPRKGQSKSERARESASGKVNTVCQGTYRGPNGAKDTVLQIGPERGRLTAGFSEFDA